jgi:hypothetical protein
VPTRSPAGYVVRDANGQALAYIYSRDTEAEALQAKVLTKDEARPIAVNVARLPELWEREIATPDNGNASLTADRTGDRKAPRADHRLCCAGARSRPSFRSRRITSDREILPLAAHLSIASIVSCGTRAVRKGSGFFPVAGRPRFRVTSTDLLIIFV